MKHGHAQRVGAYLSKHAILPIQPKLSRHWQQCMVVPCFRESPDFLLRLPPRVSGSELLVICVLNRPDSEPDAECNTLLRAYLKAHTEQEISAGLRLCRVTDRADILLLDLEEVEGPTPDQQGVGRARRLGCDLALWLIHSNRITSPWILSSDADAQWPEHLIGRGWPDASAGVALPFQHRTEAGTDLAKATLIYELWLHVYVCGLESAGSPYAFHTLGSSCAFHAGAYAAVRGMPLRAGAEDFYLLNKLAKVGSIERPSGPPILIEARASARVPFGTGPAVRRLMGGQGSENARFFYHPDCFLALKAVLDQFSLWLEDPKRAATPTLEQHLGADLGSNAEAILTQMNVAKGIDHARQHGANATARLRHLHTWFDGFRTLKFIHALRERCRADLTYLEFMRQDTLQAKADDPLALRNAITAPWGWDLS